MRLIWDILERSLGLDTQAGKSWESPVWQTGRKQEVWFVTPSYLFLLPKEMMETPPLEMFQRHLDVALGDMFSALGVTMAVLG